MLCCPLLCCAVPWHHADKDLMVHSGFLGAYDSVKNKVFRIVEQLTATRSAEDPWTVFVTGHSLGGALATLAAYDLAGRK
jgi:alpha-beta hydrolase superfamily lysophospholipase